ncbi:caspase family protein [Paenibacillus camerounensis]|uniref:caspase family protein n=1 Tax=Paenibacillus camerounensis TaxID=1243663 RepID=UPI0005A6F57C|nr:caspase family protein [Paenibacillus camerounensis]
MSRLALIVGIDNYIYWNKLRCSINDAKYMKEVLEECDFETELLLNPNKEQLQEAIITFQFSLSEYDTGLLFFAGHGVEVGGKQFLVPSDCPSRGDKDYYSTLVDTTTLINDFSSSDDFTGIILLDCCRERLDIGARNRGVTENDIFKAKGAFIAFATGPNQTAHERDKDGHGTFTYYMGETIQKYGTERIESIFKRVRKKVVSQHSDQVPWDYSSLLGDFYFKENQMILEKIESRANSTDFLSYQIKELINKNLAYSALLVEIDEWLNQFPDIAQTSKLKKQEFITFILNQLDQHVLKNE